MAEALIYKACIDDSSGGSFIITMNLQHSAMGFYDSYIVPWWTTSQFNDVYRILTRNKKVSISAAAAFVGLCFLYDRVFRPPRNLRHIPHVPFPTYIWAVMKGMQPKDTARTITMPAAARSSHGLYLVSEYLYSLLLFCTHVRLSLLAFRS